MEQTAVVLRHREIKHTPPFHTREIADFCVVVMIMVMIVIVVVALDPIILVLKYRTQ